MVIGNKLVFYLTSVMYPIRGISLVLTDASIQKSIQLHKRTALSYLQINFVLYWVVYFLIFFMTNTDSTNRLESN